MSRQCFILCRDDVSTEGPLSWPRRPRQMVRLRQGMAEAKEFRAVIGSLLCRDKISWGCVATEQFYVAT